MKKFFLSLQKWLLLISLLCPFCAFFYFNLHQYLSFETIKTYQSFAQEWTANHYSAAVSIYLLVFSALIACAIPCGTILTLLGGFLFGTIAIIYSMLGTTIGGLILFFAIRTAFGARIAAKSSGWVKKLESGFQRNAFNYLLMLRLVPIMPCWVINISAGVLNVPIKTFIIATMLGIFPATVIYVMVGRGLDKFFFIDQSPCISNIITPSMLLPLLGLAFLSLFPVFYKTINRK